MAKESTNGKRKFTALDDEIVAAKSDARLKRPRKANAPVLEPTQQWQLSLTNYHLADVDLALQIVACLLANPQFQPHNAQPFVPLAPTLPQVTNIPVTNELPNDPMIAKCKPKDPRLIRNKNKEPRLTSNKPKDPRPSSSKQKDPRQSCSKPKDPKLSNVEPKVSSLVREAKVSCLDREKAKRTNEQNKMLAAKKLSLVLDLDHTLLHSVTYDQIDPANEAILRKYEDIDRKNPTRHLFRLANVGAWTKLRPGIWNFLEKASKLFELHINTLGSQAYAAEVVKLLDPTGSLFAGRVTSRGVLDHDDDHERIPETKNLEKVLGLEPAALIIDDTAEIWPNNQQNLIRAEMYRYFPCSSGNMYVAGPSLFEIGQDERPEDGALSSLLRVIERIHSNFFANRCLGEADVRSILNDEQRKILQGCRICFSRIIPMEEANPHLHPLWRLAERFGATCSNQIDEYVTHIVANSLGSQKVNWALTKGRFVVQPSWVEASALLYRRACEQQFALRLT